MIFVFIFGIAIIHEFRHVYIFFNNVSIYRKLKNYHQKLTLEILLEVPFCLVF